MQPTSDAAQFDEWGCRDGLLHALFSRHASAGGHSQSAGHSHHTAPNCVAPTQTIGQKESEQSVDLFRRNRL
jgi:hypothetical protein